MASGAFRSDEILAVIRRFERANERWSFIDGPITANNPMGVHHAWGRTYKDLFQRYQASLGKELRYQNGFDCQGLWIEVGVERELGLNSKREIEEYGLEAFAAKCRDVVVRSSAELTKGSIRLGQWMDWGNDYLTFSDTNIEYIWRFLKIVHERGWLYVGHRSTEWCPRCGTSLSQHELRQILLLSGVGAALTATSTRRGLARSFFSVSFKRRSFSLSQAGQFSH